MALDFTDVMLERGYSGVRAYCQSKLAQILFTIDFAEELRAPGSRPHCLHPATYMNTTMVRRAGVTPTSSVEQRADAILHLATATSRGGADFSSTGRRKRGRTRKPMMRRRVST